MSRTVRAADGIWWMRTLLVNVAFVGSSERWVLVDAGVRPHPRVAVPDRALVVSASRPARRRRRDGVVLEVVPARSDRSERTGAAAAGRSHRAWPAGVAL